MRIVAGIIIGPLLGYGILGDVIGAIISYLAGMYLGIGVGHLVIMFQSAPKKQEYHAHDREER